MTFTTTPRRLAKTFALAATFSVLSMNAFAGGDPLDRIGIVRRAVAQARVEQLDVYPQVGSAHRRFSSRLAMRATS